MQLQIAARLSSRHNTDVSPYPYAQPCDTPVSVQCQSPPSVLSHVEFSSIPARTSDTHPLTLSPLVPPPLLAALVPPPPASPCTLASSGCPPHLLASRDPLPAYPLPPPAIGNLVLSSCPGKKIRLDVPPHLRARPAVSRDIYTDLDRARRFFGVSAIVCCLFDHELQLLGTPFESYSRIAAQLGLALFRLPVLEGHAPDHPRHLDDLLDLVISQYTLQGKSVLVHCRGGVGRAGLVACAWLFKTGLVSLPRINYSLTTPINLDYFTKYDPPPLYSVFSSDRDVFERCASAYDIHFTQIGAPPVQSTVRVPNPAAATTVSAPPSSPNSHAPLDLQVVRAVELAIDIVRKRRSVKAIETAAQVNFLFEYLQYLQSSKYDRIPPLKLDYALLKSLSPRPSPEQQMQQQQQQQQQYHQQKQRAHNQQEHPSNISIMPAGLVTSENN